MTYQLDTGRHDEDPNTWTWLDEDEAGVPLLQYRQPTVPEYNTYKRARAAYFDRLQTHIEGRRDEIDEELEVIYDDLDELTDDELDRLRQNHLLSGFRPTDDEIDAFVSFCVACTTGVRNMGYEGTSVDWSDDEGLVEALPPDTPEGCRRRIIESLGESAEQRVASILAYSRAIAQGLPRETKKK